MFKKYTKIKGVQIHIDLLTEDKEKMLKALKKYNYKHNPFICAGKLNPLVLNKNKNYTKMQLKKYELKYLQWEIKNLKLELYKYGIYNAL